MNGCIIHGTPIAVDFWQAGRHPGIKLFFLTHLHGDHVVGLTSSWRQPLHCSPITAQLLKQRYGLDHSLIRPLEVGQSHLIHCCQGHCVRSFRSDEPSAGDGPEKNASCDFMTVTVIDANHCAGAVMFLFEGRFGKILHTGDFRYSEDMFEEGSPLSQHVGTIDVVYLDNTYCSPWCVFPPRVEVVNQIIDIMKSHEGYDILFGVRGLGKEELLVTVALSVGEWVNVPPATLSLVTAVGFPNVFQTGHPDSRLRVVPFHTVSGHFVKELNRTKPTIVILPTALYQGIDGKPYANIPEVFVVPYSDHSSYPELVQFVSKLKPVCVRPVVHGKVRGPFGVDVSSREDMSCFRKYLTKPRCSHPAVSTSEECSVTKSSTIPQGQGCPSGGFQDLFRDFQGVSSRRRKSVNRARRKILCPKGVNYMSDEDLEEVSPKKSRKTEKRPVVCSTGSTSIPGEASHNQQGQDKHKVRAVCWDGLEKDSRSLAPRPKKAVNVSMGNKTEQNLCDEGSQCSALSPQGKDSCWCVEGLPLKNRNSEMSVCVGAKEPRRQLPQCRPHSKADCEGSSTSKSNHLHSSSHERQTAAASSCRKISHHFENRHENFHPPKSPHITSTQTKRKTYHKEGCQSSVCCSPARQKTCETALSATSQGRMKKSHPDVQFTGNSKSHTAQSIEPVSTLIQKYFMDRNGGKSDVSGRQQRNKLMDTYNRIFGASQSPERTQIQDTGIQGNKV